MTTINCAKQNVIVPLLTSTRKPRIYSDSEYGGDNLVGFYQELIGDDGKLAVIKERYHEAVSNNADLTVIQQIENDYIAYKEQLQKAVTTAPGFYQLGTKYQQMINDAANNENQRLRIVEAMGGTSVCMNVVVIYPQIVFSYPYFDVTAIPEGHNLAQYEHLAGRKGVVMKVHNKVTDAIGVVWFNQRRRETELGIHPGLWLGNVEGKMVEGVDAIIEFIEEITSGMHAIYELV